MKEVESEAEDLQFKGKRAITEGIQSYYSTLKFQAERKENFKPVSTKANLFGFTLAKRQGKRHSNPHFKTMEV